MNFKIAKYRAFIRFQHTLKGNVLIKPEGKTYTYETALNLPQKKVISQIESRFDVKNSLKWVELANVGIESDGKSLKLEPEWGIKESSSAEDLPSIIEEVQQVIKSEEQEENGLKCSSCNITLQSENMDKQGYFKIPRLKEQNRRKTYDFTDSETALMNEFKAMTGMTGESKVVEFNEMAHTKRIEELKEALKMNFQCERCKNIHKLGEVQLMEVESIMQSIPKANTIVYVCSILDFPLGLDPTVVKGRRNVIYLVNKADLFYSKDVESQRLGVQYCKDILEEYMHAKSNQVHLVSAEKGWNIDQIISLLPKGEDVYFIGRANTGKSSLIKSILRKTNGKEAIFPGVGGLPGFTRANKRFTAAGGLNIIDTPGFTNENGIYQYLLNEYKTANKYTKVRPMDVKHLFKPINSKFRKVFDGKSLLSYGGLFCLQPPANAVIKVQYLMNKRFPQFEAKYSSMKRLLQLNDTRPKEVGQRFAVKPSTIYEMDQFEIPPFRGNLDIVIQDLGVFSFSPTSGPQQVDGPFKIWIPRGLKVVVRDSIFKFIYKSKEGERRRVFVDDKTPHLRELIAIKDTN